MLPRLRLKHVSFIVFTIVASLPVLILAAWVQQSALNKEVSSVEEKHLLVARNLTGDLARYVEDIESSLELVSRNMSNNNKMDGIPEHLDSLFLRHVYIVDANAEILKQVSAKSKTNAENIKPEIRKILVSLIQLAQKEPNNVHYSDLVRTGENETTFYLVKALAKNRYSVGVLSTTHIIQAQQKVSFGRRGHAAIVDRTGRAIAHPIADWVKTMKDMSFLPPVKKMMLGETGVSQFFTPAMQADMVAGYTVVPRSGWGVMVPQPFEELEERANDVQFFALIITLLGIVIAGVLSWIMAGILTDPIQSVVDATKLEKDGSRSALTDKILKPNHFVPHELKVLLSSFNLMRKNLNNLTTQLHSKIDFANAEVKNQNEQLQQQAVQLKDSNKQLEKISTTDALTEIYNRRYFSEALDKELAYAYRHDNTLSLMMFDLDDFKHINDNFGHLAGDEVLRCVARVISTNVRSSDIVCRVGGEEFAIIFRHSNLYSVSDAAEGLRLKIQKETIEYEDKQISVTASIGVVSYIANRKDNFTADNLYSFSDAAMYHSKKQGKNKVTLYSDIANS